MKKFLLALLITLSVAFSNNSYSQCTTANSICTPGVAGPFNFGGGGTAVSTCLDFLPGSQFTYIVLYVTSSGPLNLLIQGNAVTGFLDVAIFNVPSGVAPCTAILNPANEIGCNYASASSGCNQFGVAFPCASSVPAPFVNAGDVLIIVVEDWSNGPSSTFTLQLGPTPGAQTGPPNTSITPVGPFCTTDPALQLFAVNMGGTWTGAGVSPTGMFNPALAGPGTHTITYSLGTVPCNSTSTTTITVNTPPVAAVTVTNETCSGACDGTADAGVPGATYFWTPGGMTTQTISGLCPGIYTVTITQGGCTSTGSGNVLSGPFLVVSPISHN